MLGVIEFQGFLPFQTVFGLTWFLCYTEKARFLPFGHPVTEGSECDDFHALAVAYYIAISFAR